MSKARTLADFISDGSTLADGAISVAEVSGAAPTASPTFTGNATFDTDTLFVDSTNSLIGVGTTSPSHPSGTGITVYDASIPRIAFKNSTTGNTSTDGSEIFMSGNTMFIQNRENNAISLATNATTRFTLGNSSGSAVFNEGGDDYDFRVESDNNANMLFVNAGDDKIGLGTGSTQGVVTIEHDLNNSSDWWTNAKNALFVGNTNASGQTVIKLNNQTNTRASLVFNTSGTGRFQLFDRTSAQERLGITASETVFNEDSADRDFRVESDDDTHMFFIDANENAIGIGDTAPRDSSWGNATDTRQLSIEANAFSVLHLKATNTTTRWGMGAGAGKLFAAYDDVNAIHHLIHSASESVFNEDSHDIDFRVESNNLTHAFFVDASADKIGIGMSDPATYGSRLNVEYNGGSTNSPISCINTATSGTRRMIDFFDGSSTSRKGAIETNGSVTNYLTSSDRRLKTDIQPIVDGTNKLMAMNPITHKWKADPNTGETVHGFIAQEMQEIVPEAVSGDPDGEEMMSMDYGRITPVLVAALQDAMKEITALKERVAELEAK